MNWMADRERTQEKENQNTLKGRTVYVASNRLMEFGVYTKESLDKATAVLIKDMRSALQEKGMPKETIEQRLANIHWQMTSKGTFYYILVYQAAILETYAIAPFEIE